MSVLGDILASKRRELSSIDDVIAELQARVGKAGRTPLPCRDLLARTALRLPAAESRAPLRLLAEVKFRSPSAGALSRALDAPTRAEAYSRAGASLVSVLCDGPFFGGSFHDLAAARARLDASGLRTPLLAKEFVLDARQVAAARAAGADAVLLIVRILPGSALRELVVAAREAELEPIVEVVDEAELHTALAAGARVVGVNARDLDTLAMDAARATRVLSAIPDAVVSLHLSGIRDAAAVRAVASGPAAGALVGEVLMREDDPGPLLRSFVEAASLA